MNLLRFNDLQERKIVRNRMQLSRLVRTEGFPPGFMLSANARAWLEDDVDAWIEARAKSTEAAA